MNDQLAAQVICWALVDYGGGGTGISIVVGCITCDISNKDNGGPIVTPVRS